MCGRFSLTAPGQLWFDIFGLPEPPPWAPRYNIAPTQPAPTVVRIPDQPHRQFRQLRWGLIPSWAKDPGIGARMINAQAETAAVKPAFRVAFRQRRCLVLADGFPNALIRAFHHRMPVILAPEDYDLWLDPAIQDTDRVQPLLHQYPPEEMMAYPVSPRVNNPANDTPECIAPLGDVPDLEPGEASRRPKREK